MNLENSPPWNGTVSSEAASGSSDRARRGERCLMSNMGLILSEAMQVALILGCFSFLGSVVAGIAAIIAARRSAKVEAKVDANTALTVETKGQVVALKKNTDGMTADLLTLTARASGAEGQIKGAAQERDRPPEFVTDPEAVRTALKQPDVRDQINIIEEKVKGVMKDLDAGHERADAHKGEEPGAAADASAKQTAKEKHES